jgi:hypothetical protein
VGNFSCGSACAFTRCGVIIDEKRELRQFFRTRLEELCGNGSCRVERRTSLSWKRVFEYVPEGIEGVMRWILRHM